MFEKILKEIKPSKKEIESMKSKVNEFVSKLKLDNCEAFVGGSYAKNTWLKEQHDIDIFVLFREEENMSEKLEKFIKRSFKKYERIHGSRDYFLVNFRGINFELIPVLKIENYKDAKNITDVSQLHVKWVKSKLNEKQCDEARLMKQFCMANRVYGAETYIKGLHGYLLEILTYYYRDFIKFVKNASKWKKGLVIDVNRHSLFKSQQDFPLIVIDPVHANRNAASSLGEEKFELFVNRCKEFLKKKDLNYFKVKKFSLKGYNLILTASPLTGSTDVAGTKLYKVFEKINYELIKNNFKILKSDWDWDGGKAYFCFKIENKKLSKLEKYFGPPIKLKEYVKKFKKKYKKYKFGIGNNRIFVIKPRKFNDTKKLIKVIIRDKQVKNRVKSIKVIKS